MLAIVYVFASCPLSINALFAIALLHGLILALNVFMNGQIMNTRHVSQSVESTCTQTLHL